MLGCICSIVLIHAGNDAVAVGGNVVVQACFGRTLPVGLLLVDIIVGDGRVADVEIGVTKTVGRACAGFNPIGVHSECPKEDFFVVLFELSLMLFEHQDLKTPYPMLLLKYLLQNNPL